MTLAQHETLADLEPAGARGVLLDVTYRMLGSFAEAEDAVQETYARWYALSPAERGAIARPTGWLVRVASRVCLDVLGSARARREKYVGEWLPEPVPSPARWSSQASGSTDPAERVTSDETVGMAFLIVLETMTPAERVAFVLKDVFAFPFDEIAAALGRSPAACRQLASSARRRVRDAEGAEASLAAAGAASAEAEVVAAFRRAWETGDLDGLLGVLDPEATVIADGGGKVAAALEPIDGAAAVARFFADVLVKAPSLVFTEDEVNGRPGVLVWDGDMLVTVMAVDVRDGRVVHAWAVRNPDKLRLWR
ncbi:MULTISPECIES: RNA polymerase sigma factor SigJ [Mumia]|uniref:RNA polymerase sigma factor SigJ n=1 Tax=Mumia TaxID=1546255 RepID=UPI00141E55D3|nr:MULTISPECIES: RNA polymerase sigma factor SigJ [unclassified Mumia]QMW67151.1 RNA polymerase sigma factor SigJ [Mumia sp. ZJ1417]